MKANWGKIAGYVMSGLVIAFMLFDGVIKLIPLDIVIKTNAKLGYKPELAPVLGVLGLVCTALYAFRPTAVLGAILLTAYMGGAMASHLRVGDPLFTHTLFGMYLAVLAWGGLYLRNPTIRMLLPTTSCVVPTAL